MTPTPDLISDYITKAGRAAWAVPGIAQNTAKRPIKSIGIIGAGTMGGGISMNFATAGYDVTIVETTPDALAYGLGVVRANYQRSADKGRFAQTEVAARMDRYQGRTNIADLAGCDLVIEAVFEDIELKKSVFTELDRVMKPGAILATNTSALNIDAIAAMTNRARDVIGLHFFSPANVMKLLEIVRARDTGDDVVATCMDIAKTINKVAVLVGVCPGFVGNRMLFQRQVQARNLLYQGVMPWDIDAALNAFGFRMGPFQMSDLAGLDIGWKKGAKTDNPIRDALCERDRRGQKTSAGFYDYDDQRHPNPSPVTEDIIATITGAAPKTIAPGEIVSACLHPMINEGVKILEERKAQRASDIDVVWLNGYGWPPDTGGPMFYGDMVGAGAILATMERLARNDAPISPAETLKKLAHTGGRFIDIDTGGLKT